MSDAVDTYEELGAAHARAQWQPGATVEERGGRWLLHRGSQKTHRTVTLWSRKDGPGFRLDLPVRPAEAFLGLGERFDRLDLRGGDYLTRVYDQYKHQGSRSYLPIPSFVSTLGYGLWLDTSLPARWQFGDEVVRIEVLNSSSLEVKRFEGEPLDVVAAFCRASGPPSLPPPWAFGPWMSGNEWNSQAAVEAVVRRSLELDIPISAIVIEAWSDEATFYIWNDARYTLRHPAQPPRLADFEFPADGRWPDPRGLIDWLHRLGIRVLLWQIPVIRQPEDPSEQLERDRAHALREGYLLQAGGAPYRSRSPWFQGSHLPDFSHSAARRWWLSLRRYLLEEMGVDGFKTDGGEHVWGQDVGASNGLSGHALGNEYPSLYTAALASLVGEVRGSDGLIFSRAGYTGSQRHPYHWTGDHDSDWDALRSNITAMLSASVSGFPFIGWDLAGFSGSIPSAELYQRSAALACFTPLMQYHSEFNDHRQPPIDRTPWNVAEQTGDPTVIDVYRSYAHLRLRLGPYICAQARHSARTGVPLMRPLILVYPQDLRLRTFPYEYLFGDNFLICPVTAPGVTEVEVYLPEGQWLGFWTGTRHEGPQVLTYPAPVERIPVFSRKLELIAAPC